MEFRNIKNDKYPMFRKNIYDCIHPQNVEEIQETVFLVDCTIYCGYKYKILLDE